MYKVINEEVPYFGDDAMACSESTLRLLIERDVIDLPTEAVKMMTGMHGNMGRCANCGAVNAACAAIGAKYGRTQPDEDSKRVYRLVEEFMQAFEKEFGSVKCTDLLCGNDPADLTQQRRCSEYVLFSAAKVEQLLDKEESDK